MTMQVFVRVANYMWPGTKYTYSDANGAFGGIIMMWNPDKDINQIISSQKILHVSYAPR